MSSCRLTEARVCAVAAVALGGCMTIYPDPELPDIETRWYADDCTQAAGDVLLVATGMDTPAFAAEKRVPCGDGAATFVDLPRERYRVDGSLLTPDGIELTTYWEEVDLRNGLDERIDMYFARSGNVRVGWTFAMGSSCAALGADRVTIEFDSETYPEPAAIDVDCEQRVFVFGVGAGTYTFGARAYEEDRVVAVAAPVEAVVTFEDFTLVDLVLTPCAGECRP